MWQLHHYKILKFLHCHLIKQGKFHNSNRKQFTFHIIPIYLALLNNYVTSCSIVNISSCDCEMNGCCTGGCHGSFCWFGCQGFGCCCPCGCLLGVVGGHDFLWRLGCLWWLGCVCGLLSFGCSCLRRTSRIIPCSCFLKCLNYPIESSASAVPVNCCEIQVLLLFVYFFGSSPTQCRSTTHPKFDPMGVRTHDLQIMTVHFMSLRRLL